jgi:hypothetical protein
VALTLNLFSCKKKGKDDVVEVPPREYVESEVIENAVALLEEAVDINTVLWGVGILPVENEEDGAYRACQEEELMRYGIRCVADIRTLTESVYSKAMCKTVESTVLGNVRDENESIVSYVRYYDLTDKETGDVTLMVKTDAYVYFEKPITYHSETVKVKGVKGEVITLTVEVTLYDEENVPHEKTLTFSMIEEADGWKLHSPTYMKYDAYSDIYENLIK